MTRTCLECHPESAREVMQTAHRNGQGEVVTVPGHDRVVRIGKRNVINNFCIGVQSDWPTCTMCHVGYGWEDEDFDFNDASRVDCLVCHDNSGIYMKNCSWLTCSTQMKSRSRNGGSAPGCSACRKASAP